MQKGLLLTALLIISALPALATPQPDRDPEIERALGYRFTVNRLDNKPAPGAFAICVDSDGIGHLQTYFSSSARLSGPVPISKDWQDRISFQRHGETERTKLTMSDAKRFWGEPKRHVIEGAVFYTFDAHSPLEQVMDDQVQEDNIYHLDLKFDDKGIIAAYRIRGIGISKPIWISAEWKPPFEK